MFFVFLYFLCFFFFNDTATTEIYTLSLHDALPIWALEERSSGAFLGRAGLYRPEYPDWPGVEVGWTLHPDHWGRGYATEAGAEAIRYAFEDLDLDRIYSCILPENEASQAVAVRLGMELLEERTMDFFPSAPHGIWSRAR